MSKTYNGNDKIDKFFAHYGRKGMKRGMNIFNPDYVPVGKKAEMGAWSTISGRNNGRIKEEITSERRRRAEEAAKTSALRTSQQQAASVQRTNNEKMAKENALLESQRQTASNRRREALLREIQKGKNQDNKNKAMVSKEEEAIRARDLHDASQRTAANAREAMARAYESQRLGQRQITSDRAEARSKAILEGERNRQQDAAEAKRVKSIDEIGAKNREQTAKDQAGMRGQEALNKEKVETVKKEAAEELFAKSPRGQVERIKAVYKRAEEDLEIAGDRPEERERALMSLKADLDDIGYEINKQIEEANKEARRREAEAKDTTKYKRRKTSSTSVDKRPWAQRALDYFN